MSCTMSCTMSYSSILSTTDCRKPVHRTTVHRTTLPKKVVHSTTFHRHACLTEKTIHRNNIHRELPTPKDIARYPDGSPKTRSQNDVSPKDISRSVRFSDCSFRRKSGSQKTGSSRACSPSIAQNSSSAE